MVTLFQFRIAMIE